MTFAVARTRRASTAVQTFWRAAWPWSFLTLGRSTTAEAGFATISLSRTAIFSARLRMACNTPTVEGASFTPPYSFSKSLAHTFCNSTAPMGAVATYVSISDWSDAVRFRTTCHLDGCEPRPQILIIVTLLGSTNVPLLD